MTLNLLFSSKWLACALALLGLAVIRTSHGLKCHMCINGKCIEEVCPEGEILKDLKFPSDTEMTCLIGKEGNDILKGCSPFGKQFVALLGGQDKCKEGETSNSQFQKIQLESIALQATSDLEAKKFFREYGYLKASGQPIPPAMQEKHDRIYDWAEQYQPLAARSRDSGSKITLCTCQTDLCNVDDLVNGASVLEIRNRAIIVLAAFACILVHGI